MRITHSLFLVPVLAVATSCGGSGDAKQPLQASDPIDFSFAVMVERPLGFTATLDGLPAQGVAVQVRERPTTESLPGVFLDAVTDRYGKIDTVLRVPEAVTDVELLVHFPGAEGPYSEEARRSADGITAVSALIESSPASLERIVVPLVSVAGGVR